MFDAHLPSHLWVDSIITATYLINHMPSPTTNNKSTYQLLYNLKPDYNHRLRVFGYSCYPLFPTPAHHKLQPRTTQCVFLGYPPDIKGFKCLHPSTGHTYITRHIVFDKNFSLSSTSPTPLSSTLQSSIPSSTPLLLTPTSLPTSTEPPPTTHPPLNSSQPAPFSIASLIPNHHSTPASSYTSSPHCPLSLLHSSTQIPHHPLLTRAKMGSLKPKPIFDLLHIPNFYQTPTSLSQALKSAPWREAMSQVFMALQTQGTWDLIPPPPSHTILGNRWTYRHKYHADDTIAHHKTRLVA